MKVIANTTVISNFASVRQLELLHNLLVDVYISTEVYGEIQDGVTEGIEHYQGIEEDIYPFSLDGWLHLTSLQGDDELRLFNSLPAALHRGESSCLAIASARGWAFIRLHSLAQRTLPAVVFGGMVVAGEVKGQWTPLLRRSGGFLPSCGAFFPALDAKGFGKEVVRRSWAAQISPGPAVRRC